MEAARSLNCNPEAGLFCSRTRETGDVPDLFGATGLEGGTDEPKPWTLFFF